MATPVKQSIPINFAGGLDTKSDPWQVDNSSFSALNNMVFTTGGRLTKRNGFASSGFTKTTASPVSLTYSAVPGTLTAARKVFSYNNEILLNDAWSLYSYDSAAAAWNYRGRSTRVSLATQSVMSPGSLTFYGCDSSIDTQTGIKVFTGCANDGTHAYYSIQDTATGQIIVNQASLGAYNYLRCISIPGKSWVFGVNAGDGKIYYQAIVGQTVTGSPTALITNLNATHQTYDVDVDPNTGNIYIAWATTTPSISIAALSSSMVVGNTITKTETAANGLSWFPDGTNIWVCYSNGTDTKAFIVNNAVSSTTLAPTVVTAGSGNTVNSVTGCYSSTNALGFIFYDKVTLAGGANSLVSTAQINVNTLTVGGSAGTDVLFMGSVSINSKAFPVSGIPHIGALYTNYSVEATNFLLNLYNVTPSMGGSANNDAVANIAAKFAPWEAAQTCLPGGKNGGSGTLPGVHQNASGLWEMAFLQNNNYSGSASVYFIQPTSVMDVQFDFSQSNPDVLTLGNNAILAGASVLSYDGAAINEQNFHIYPPPPGVSIANGGGGTHLGSGSYGYVAVYEWIDNQGQIQRSFPSPVTSASSSGTDGVATLTLKNLRATNKSGSQVVIAIYRTAVNGSVYYRLASSFNGLGAPINDPAANTTTYTDSAPDSLIIGNIQLYTTGGAQGYFAPPASNSLTAFKNRAISLNSEEPYSFDYSNAALPNFPVQFVPFFQQNIASAGGALVAVANMDDKIILFKSGTVPGAAIWYMTGQGPAPSGAGNDFVDPQPIAVDAGLQDRASIVLTPVGLMFKSSKGIYLIDRALQAAYIGAPVEGYNSYSVLSAQLIPSTTQVRFLLSSGTMLVYDYFYKKWATFTPPAAISDCIYQGKHTFVTSAGQVYQEAAGTYTDGATAVLMSFSTAWIKMAGLMGYQRAYEFFLLGQYLSSHQIQLQIAYDYDPTIYQTDLITPDTTSVEYWRVHLAIQRCSSFQIQFTEVSTGTNGASLYLSGLNIIAGFKSPRRTISAANSVG